LMDNVMLLPRSTVSGYYDHNFLVINQRRTDHQAGIGNMVARERNWRVRARQVVLATGAIERGLVFADNDRPGVMLSSAVRTYINRYAVRPGRTGAVFTNNDSAYQTAVEMYGAGMEVKGVIDVRQRPSEERLLQMDALGIPVYSGHGVGGTRRSRQGLRAVELCRLSTDGREVLTQKGSFDCQVLAVSGGWNPTIHLHCQSGGRPEYDDSQSCFLPGKSVQSERSAGSALGIFQLDNCLRDGIDAGVHAVREAGYEPVSIDIPHVSGASDLSIEPMWDVPDGVLPGRGGRKFVDYQNDTTVADIALAAREGYRSIEHVKRYTALGFGTDQGKTGNINGLAILAEHLGQSIPATGTTTFRPNYTPVTFGAIAGRELGAVYFDPVRKTPMHHWHVAHGAVFEDVGQWKRPWYYPKAGETMESAVSRECLATRRGIGLLDASTLGKIEVRGRDSAEFLNRIYTNAWSKLEINRCRYGLMLGEDGMVMDDGVSSRLGDNHYYMTTTTGGAAHVLGWMERWHQTEWPELEVFFTSVTDRWAVASIAGPNSRALLGRLCSDIDLSAEAFPFMSLREGSVAGISARVFRISFSGELAFEINVSADDGVTLWESLMEAGGEYDITPYGTETMHVLRAEKGYVIVGQDTDGSVTPADLGMDWIVSKTKDFIGKRSLVRSDMLRENRKQLVGLVTEQPQKVLPEGTQLVNEPSKDYPVPMTGHVTSSYYSPILGHSIALALVKGGHSRMGASVYAPTLDGQLIEGIITSPVFYDPENRLHKT
ncbi:MAG: glycine cleavage T C-terminal barrel domain-containing protein, partial [Pseudomonadota bacterium]|nr:glycine cleavage T C-terminal barrel domain-containing protein [Pseudomonadota bacterium]